jgi:molybdenum-dependent DNA-binding transcriptional regulator ModE
MHKPKAIELLGGTIASAAKAIGISYQAVDKWPEQLPPRIADRVLAAVARQRLGPELSDAMDTPKAPVDENAGV